MSWLIIFLNTLRVLPYVIDLGSSNGTYLNNTRWNLSCCWDGLFIFWDFESFMNLIFQSLRIESKRYYELKVILMRKYLVPLFTNWLLQESDVLKFGYSTREYVLLHENSGEWRSSIWPCTCATDNKYSATTNLSMILREDIKKPGAESSMGGVGASFC